LRDTISDGFHRHRRGLSYSFSPDIVKPVFLEGQTLMDRSETSRPHFAEPISRRRLLGGAAIAAGSAALAGLPASAAEKDAAEPFKGAIKQSLVQWCYQKYWNIDELCAVAKQLGCKSVELAN